MKTFILTIAMSLMSIFSFGQRYTKLWNQVEQYEEDGKPKSAYQAAEKILKKAQRGKDKGQALCARLKMAELHQEWAPDSFFTDILDLEAMRTAEPTAAGKAVYASLLAELYERNRARSQARDLELTSDDMREWTQEQYDSAAVANWHLSMQDIRALAAAKSKDWLPFIEQEEQSAYFKHDLLHVLWNRAKEQKDDVWVGTKDMLANMAKRIVEEYERLGNREAALLMSLEWVDLQHDEDDTKLLEALKTKYADMPLCTEVYLALIDDTYNSERRVALARECIQRYPRYERLGAVRNKLNNELQPRVNWYGRSIYYPGKTYDWRVTSQNAKLLTFEILRMPTGFNKNALSGDLKVRIAEIRKKGTPVTAFTQELAMTDPWKQREDTIRWKALEPGNYMLILTAEAQEAEATAGSVQEYAGFITSRLQPLDHNGFGQQRVVVVDSETGHPVEGAQVEFYYEDDKQNRKDIATLMTDAEGRVTLDDRDIKDKDFFRIYHTVTYKDDIHLDVFNHYYSPYSRDREKADPSTILRLYSDRSIYRPGQVVHIAGILYEQMHWDANVAEPQELTLTLRDANGKTVAEQMVKSDEMGKISADFVLPQGGLPGRYTVRGTNERAYANYSFRVEEYKRPTFEVTMDPAPDMQWPADTITLTGKAMGYNGVPIREGRVTGTYQFTYPWWWSNRRDSDRLPIDTLETDEDGRFSVPVPLKSLTDETLRGGLTLKLNVEVLSVAGETHEAQTSVMICKKPLRIYVNAPSQQDRDRLQDLSIELISSTGKPTAGRVEWDIFTVNEKKRTSEEPVMSGTVVSEGTDIRFDKEQLSKLPAGQYEFYVKGYAGEHTDSTQAYFLLFGMDDTKLPKVTKEWLYCPDATFNAERPARIQVGTSFEDVSFYYSIVAESNFVRDELITLSDELKVIEIPYSEDYGDGATFHYIFVKEGKVYRGNQTLRLTQPDRTLTWEWKTFRDRLHPGDSETWTLALRRPDGKPASAQVMATLYDASLEALQHHSWSLFVNRPYTISSLSWDFVDYFSHYASENLRFPMKHYNVIDMDFDSFDSDKYDGLGFGRYRMLGAGRGAVVYEAMPMPVMAAQPEMRFAQAKAAQRYNSDDDMADAAEAEEANATAQEGEEKVGEASATVRTNFNETAAFLPRLMTNAKGEVNISFTLPESLTTWKMLGLAHTEDMMSTTFSGEVIARKEMMARLYLPRFLRVDDKASVRAIVQNMTEAEMSGNATLEIFDPETERIILKQKQPFSAKANGECLLVFDYTPTDDYTVVAVRLTADSKTFSDGEQHYLPILPSKTYVTESVEIRADSLGTFTTDLTSLFNKNNPTATNRRLTVEYTTHPIWHALQALPSLIEPQYDDIISLATSLQAQSLATYIANNTPRLKELVEIWQREQAQGQPALTSRLAEDEELKQIILDETPWLREAENEADRKARLIQLFNISQQEQTLVNIAERMEKRLEADGGFSWFPGMRSSEVMTRIVASELARLRVMTNDMATLPSAVKSAVNHMLSRNVEFISKWTALRVSEMKEAEKEGATIHTASLFYLEYVYTTQHAGVTLTKSQKADVKYLLDHMNGSVAGMDNWERAIAAVVMKGDGRNKEARQYYESLLEHLTTTPDHGAFFDYAGGSFRPTSHKIIHHVAAMEAVNVMEPANKKLQRELRRWLLQQKRTQMWESNICTADAIYALVTGNTAELNASSPDDITLNYADRNVEISRKDADEAVSGLGFIKKQFADGEAPKSITVERHTDSEAWGAVFATYLTPMVDASASSTGLKVRRELNTTNATVGQRMTTRYVITADRDYEYVCLRAARAACMEPAEQLSGYRYQGGLGYYRAVRDAHTDYFFDSMPKGTYVLEETAFIDRDGTYTTGLTTVRCLYAPEYGANTSALEINVAKENR